MSKEQTTNIKTDDIDEIGNRIHQLLSIAEKKLKNPISYDDLELLSNPKIKEQINEACMQLWKIQLELNKLDPRILG